MPRVAVNTKAHPWTIFTSFFDRKMEGEDMKLHVDKSADALYLRLDDSTIVESEEVSPGIILDYNESGQVIGVEMLHLSRRSAKMKLSTLEFEAA